MKFKVGDKVKTRFGIGKIVETKNWGIPYLVYHDVWNEGHDGNGDSEQFYEGNHCWWFDENDLELANTTTINDLQFADVVTLRNGERYVVADNTLYGEDDCYQMDAWGIENCYNNDLTYNEDDGDYDIVKVERNGSIIYEREETKVKEMTVAEISEVLGYEVKIVKEK